MKATLWLPLLLVVHLVLQLALLAVTVGAQEKPGQNGEKSPKASLSRDTGAQDLTCAANLTIAGCLASAAERGKLTTFVKLAKATGLEEILNGPGPYTVFVPTDEAFSALSPGKIAEISKLGSHERLREVLYPHVAKGNLLMKEISRLSGSGATAVSLLQGALLNIAKEGEVNGARILRADITASNGTIHIIGSVILTNKTLPDGPPPTAVAQPTPSANQERPRDRIVKVSNWPNEPVKIVAVKLRGGEQIKSGITFRAADDWVRGLTLTVTNVANKPVCFIHIQLNLPRTDDDAGEAANDSMMFACDPVNDPQPRPLAPGKSMDIVLTDSDYVAHEALLQRHGYPPTISDLELKVIEVQFFGDKDRKWWKGQMLREDPNSPGDWHPDGQVL